MTWRRYTRALLLSFLAVTVFDILWNAVLLRGVYRQTAGFWRPAEELNRLGTLGFVTMVPWPVSLIVAMAFQAALNNVLTGLFFGWLY